MSAPAKVERFPEELRVRTDSARFEAVGRRASAREQDGRIRVTIDGITARALVEVAGRPAAGKPEVWPFGARRTYGGEGPGRVIERIFAATDQPSAVIEWQGEQSATIRLEVDNPDGLRVLFPAHAARSGDSVVFELEAGGVARLVFTTSGGDVDVAGLLGAAVARARRRAAQRPRLIIEGGAGAAIDPLAEAELRIRATPDRKQEGAEADEAFRGRAAIAIALLGLNDRDLARQLLATGAAGPAQVALAGAWAAWTGDAAAIGARWSALSSGLVALAEARPTSPDAWSQAAISLGPTLADVRGDRALEDRLRRMQDRPEPATALAALGREPLMVGGADANVAGGETLAWLHGALGIVPDAPRGRARLAPRVGNSRLELSGLSVGDAVIALRIDPAARGRVILHAEQTHGPVPYTLILEPWLPWRRLTSASVDGRGAELDAIEEGDGLRIRVQVVADHAREIVLDLE